MLRVALNHRTSYRYDRAIELGPQTIRLRPAPHCRTPIESYSLRVEPRPHFLNWLQDPHGNFLARVVFPEPVSHFQVEVDLVAEMVTINPFDFFLEPEAEAFPFQYDEALHRDLLPYLERDEAGPLLREFLSEVSGEPTHIVTFLVDLNQRLGRAIEYLIRMEPGVQPPEKTLRRGSGSCRDSGWLMVQILRHLGLAARFTSGYLIQLTPDVKSLDGPSGTERDFTDLHAWAEVYVPGAGWIGLDPTSGLLAGEGHLPLASTPRPSSAAPISGNLGECEVDFDFTMSVQRIAESPRVTRPYTAAQWAAIDGCGAALDERIAAGDMRLTMGGEPTFVALDDPDGEEWHTAALGPRKRGLAIDLIRRLHARHAPGGLLQYSQGKWYPGEPLPRWALAVYWRDDGLPLWGDPDLIAGDVPEGDASIEEAEAFGRQLAADLDVDPTCLLPAYEDPLEAIADEQRLPEDLVPDDPRLDDERERASIARRLQARLSRPRGFVLPIQPWLARDGRVRWRTEQWTFRRGALCLIPGDSPIGFRLPLETLPRQVRADDTQTLPRVPFQRQSPLPSPEEAHRARQANQQGSPVQQPKATTGGAANSEPSIRTALALELRDGQLCVFLPPVGSAEAFIDLSSAVERTARTLSCKVHLEGYPPPPDHRLRNIRIAPDPGVIEVNIHPSATWGELVETTTGLYERARQARLVTEKFLLDGRHVGTGGGNHIVVGGPTPADSPFLRRPDLLRGLVAYWQNHPSLSNLFSGLFIGPTSQAPRVDEARQDALYELEIAFSRVPDPGASSEPVFPWLVDRLFRNLLVDVTGNTHRTEICIDKLYAPDSATGRLGLVELRAFEMPPHAQMSLAQALLLRSILVRLWESPYPARLVRWGTRLHDQFMLPHFLWRDFADVLDDLGRHDIRLDLAWFLPHHEFRFPVLGTAEFQGIAIELRQALEPWHVLGEESVAGATARHVDSSVERLQVRITGMDPDRYALLCGGRRVPLVSTGQHGEWVAGVRYRAWQPPFCLHPTIGVHTPLVFDLVDTWSSRAVGGCTYHVGHPGGRNYESFPVNAYEAEARRLARFEAGGHTPRTVSVPHDAPSAEFPLTLDLRRARPGA